jgi:hypothetical protein
MRSLSLDDSGLDGGGREFAVLFTARQGLRGMDLSGFPLALGGCLAQFVIEARILPG